MCFQLRLACTNSVHSIHVSGSGGIKGSPFVFRMVAEQPGSFESLSLATLRLRRDVTQSLKVEKSHCPGRAGIPGVSWWY